MVSRRSVKQTKRILINCIGIDGVVILTTYRTIYLNTLQHQLIRAFSISGSGRGTVTEDENQKDQRENR